jgi:hypothetical protein
MEDKEQILRKYEECISRFRELEFSLFEEGYVNIENRVVTRAAKGKELAKEFTEKYSKKNTWVAFSVEISSYNNVPMLKVCLGINGSRRAELQIRDDKVIEFSEDGSDERRYFALKGDEGMKELAEDLRKTNICEKVRTSKRIQSYLNRLKSSPPEVYNPLVQVLFHLGLTEIQSPVDVLYTVGKNRFQYVREGRNLSIDDPEDRQKLFVWGYLNIVNGVFSLSSAAKEDILNYENLVWKNWKKYKGNWKLRTYSKAEAIEWEALASNGGEDKDYPESEKDNEVVGYGGKNYLDVQKNDEKVEDYFSVIGDEAYQEFAKITPVELLRDMMNTVLRYEQVGKGFRKTVSTLLEKKMQLLEEGEKKV